MEHVEAGRNPRFTVYQLSHLEKAGPGGSLKPEATSLALDFCPRALWVPCQGSHHYL